MKFPKQNEIDDFILKNNGFKAEELRLKHAFRSGFHVHINQMEVRQKMSHRFPQLINRKNYIFPKPSLLAQASSEATSLWRANQMSLIEPLTNVLEVTGGSGIDTWGLEKAGAQNIDICETNETLCDILKYNGQLLEGVRNIFNTDANNFSPRKTYNWLYADPSRIDSNGNRVFHPKQCSPNPLESIFNWEKWATYVAIKLSPMLEPQEVLKWFPNCKFLITLSVRKEVKELIMISSQTHVSQTQILAVDLNDNGTENYRILLDKFEIQESSPQPLPYIYDPDPVIVASNCISFVSNKWNLKTLHISSRILTSSEFHSDFPGRIFAVIKKEKPFEFDWPSGASIISRNFPTKAEEIKKRLKCKESAEHFLFAYTDASRKKWFLRCKRISIKK